MEKVIIFTWYKSINYGTCLQAYALYYKLKEMGYDVRLSETTEYKTIITLTDTVRRLCKKLFKRNTVEGSGIILPESMEKQYEIRRRKMYSFSENHINFYKIQNKSDFKKMNDENDIFITGSDQIWNPYYLSVACLLKFVSDNKKKISYATSVGVSSIPNDLKKVYKKNLSRFDSLSVREETAAELLTEVVGREIEVVADPTFLLSKEALTNIASEDNADAVKATNGEKFIFCYFIGANQDWVKEVKKLSEQTGCKVINAMTESRIIPDVGKSYAHFGMSDFLWLIKNATYVCTDSFHCTALSVNMEKEFFVFKRFLDTDTNSQNSRLYSLLKRFDLDERLVTNDDNINEKAKREINYSAVTKKLKEIESQSEDYLKASLTKQ